jgi:hypothetical protein
MHLKLPFTKPLEQAYGFSILVTAVSYRIAMPVTKIVQYGSGGYAYPVCPRCRQSMDREYMSYCDRCGQKLSWEQLDNATILMAPIVE